VEGAAALDAFGHPTRYLFRGHCCPGVCPAIYTCTSTPT